MRNHRLPLVLASGLAALAMLTTACSPSSGSDDGAKETVTTGGNGAGDSGAGDSAAADKAQALRSCLRGKGMDVPDLKPGANPYAEVLNQPAGVSPEKWKQALDECGSGGSGGHSDSGSQQSLDQQVKIAECVRAKGFDMPDPKAGPDGANSGFKLPQGADPEKFMKALNECAA
ncbi:MULTISPECIES: hypothetical protein [Streptosporangium]|uniref:Lipoprotein n=1 Tax=Streptosporangium brasiliense TaxID=47480 RepID=A0ABT9RJJ1_9ACTN|nr:hypothetical protein [Streptosporangium brasiliense]MDP9869002.1 hypothetical protein [Streptosporangium brasiliense]